MTYIRSSGRQVSSDPKVGTAAFICDECRRISSATAPIGGVSVDPDHYDMIHSAMKRTGVNEWEWEPQTVLGQDFPDVPDEIAQPASEAFKCASIQAYRAAVLMARSVLEASAKAKGVTTGNLLAKIDKLAENGEIRTKVAAAAHGVRMLGNDMAHGDFATTDVTKEDADVVLRILDLFLTELFQVDAAIGYLQDRHSASK